MTPIKAYEAAPYKQINELCTGSSHGLKVEPRFLGAFGQARLVVGRITKQDMGCLFATTNQQLGGCVFRVPMSKGTPSLTKICGVPQFQNAPRSPSSALLSPFLGGGFPY